jgi:5'-3' exonuclease
VTTLLVDGTNLTMRALFAMRLSTLSAHGVFTGPAMVAINSLAKTIRQVEPNRVLVAWDSGPSTRRVRLDPTYKQHRPQMTEEDRNRRLSTFDLVETFCDSANIPQLRLPNEEADDIIAGAWATTAGFEHSDIVIASSDKDFIQLLGANPNGVETRQIRFSSGKGISRAETDYWDANRVIEELGYRPEHTPLVMALTGDEVDGVRGVPGIGPKKAVKLLAAHEWDLTRVAEAIRGSHPKEVIDRIPVDLQLVDLRTPRLEIVTSPWEPPSEGEPGWSVLIDFLDHYELAETQEKLRKGTLWRLHGAEKAYPGRQSWGS